MDNGVNITTFRTSDGNTVKMEYRDSLPSSSHLAKDYALSGYPDRYVVFTEKQTEYSATGDPLSNGETEKGIYLSCILRPSIFQSQAGSIRPLGAAALANALEEHSENKIGIGWLSDIYCNGEKIGRTSVENMPDNLNSFEYLIITFAVKLDPKNFPPRLTDMVRQVFEEKSVSVPMIIAKTILNKFFSIYKDMKTPEKHFNMYFNKFIFNDKKIKFLDDGKKKIGRVVGIDKSNLSLIVESKDGRRVSISSPSRVINPNKI